MKKLLVPILLMLIVLSGCDNHDDYATQAELLIDGESVIEGILERRYDYGVTVDSPIIGSDMTVTYATVENTGLRYQVFVEHKTGIVGDKFYSTMYSEETDMIINGILSEVFSNKYECYVNHVSFINYKSVQSLQDYLDSGHVIAEVNTITRDAEKIYDAISRFDEYNINYKITLEGKTKGDNVITNETGINSVEDVTAFLSDGI